MDNENGPSAKKRMAFLFACDSCALDAGSVGFSAQ